MLAASLPTKRFPIFESETVATLLSRAYTFQLALFYEIMSIVILGEELKPNGEQWTREPYTRKKFNELGNITPDMTREEIARRVRAISFGKWKPTTKIAGFTFEMKTDSP